MMQTLDILSKNTSYDLVGFTNYFFVLTIRTKVEMILQQKYNVKDGVTHRYIIIIVIIRADTKRFTQRQCKN